MRKEEVILIDDLDNSRASETVSFALDGQEYEIDLNERNAAALRDSFREYAEAARRVKKTRAPRAGSKPGGYTNGRATGSMHSPRSTPVSTPAFTDVTVPDSPPVQQGPPAPSEPGIPLPGVIARVLGQGPKRRRLTNDDLDAANKTGCREWCRFKFAQTGDDKYKVAERGALPQRVIDVWADHLYDKREAESAAKKAAHV